MCFCYPPKIPLKIEDFEDFKGPNFKKRCVVFDINKTGFNYIAEKISDYLIVDIADSRYNVAKFGDDYTVSYTSVIEQNKALFEERFGKLTIYPFDHWSEAERNEAVDWFCEQILNLYGKNNIILLETLDVNEYRTKDNNIKQFSAERRKMNDRQNTHLKKLFLIFEKNLNDCHIIRMPDNVFADASHKWGLCPLHYHDLYYKYAYEALQIITDGGEHEEQQHLEKLRKYYSDQFALLHYKITTPHLRYENKKLLDYGYYFTRIIEHYDEILKKVDDFCKENHIQSVAFYGDYLPASALIPILNKCNVNLDYIIDWNGCHKSIPLYSPNLETYPQTDAIIICNIMSIDKIKEQLRNKTEIPVFSIYDVIPYDKK